ncbi:MAG: trypsin-like peptidase domain-containing protein [Actinomycetota bacterium]|nr:trypsin-like peptidase domain-containing protein [Actinomycetota bacterium]
MWSRSAVIVASAALLVSCSSSAAGRGSQPTDGGTQGPTGDVAASVVRVTTKGTYSTPEFGQTSTVAGSGSAFIIDPSGLAVTNNHVVAGAAAIEVFASGSSVPIPAKVVATSECADLAVIDLAGGGYQPITWATSDPEVGRAVEALGYPNGAEALIVTKGLISETGDSGATAWASIPSLVRHDAELEPGNSGGPLVASGTVVGVNVAASYAGRFAIPLSVARPIVERLLTGVGVDAIGVNATAVHDPVTNESGVWVASVEPGSRADEVGLQPGDVISRLHGLRVATDGTLADYCAVLRSAGDREIPIEVTRGNSYFAGSLGGTPLTPQLTVLDETRESVGAPTGSLAAPPEGTPYEEYVNVTDDSGQLAFDLPSAWADHRTTAVDFAGSLRPSIAAAANVDALDAAAGTTYDLAGVAAIVFDVGAPLEESFGVVVDNAPWSFSCTPSKAVPFDDGLYSGVIQAFVGCNVQGAAVVSIGLRRADQNSWLMVNVFAPTVADLQAAQRVATTLQLGAAVAEPAAAGMSASPTSTTMAPPAAGTPTSHTSVDALIAKIGVPPSAATPSDRRTGSESTTVGYTVTASPTDISVWLNQTEARLGCVDAYHGYRAFDETWVWLTCDIVEDGVATYRISIRATLTPSTGDVEIEVFDMSTF